jgi:hypothetical protein
MECFDLYKVEAPSDYMNMDGETVEATYDALCESDHMDDYEREFRGSGVETDVPCGYLRYYEEKSVAAQMMDGSWVGWTYYYGGGKHAEPGSLDWIQTAYSVDFTEETRVVKTWERV